MDLEAKWQRWMGAAQHINAALKVCYRLGLCLYEMGAPDKTEMKTNLVSEGTQNNFGVFPICIAAPNFKKECFAPELLEKKLCQNCEFFPEIFRCLLVQTGFLLATMGIGYPVAFEKSHWPLLNTQWPWAFVTALPRNAELCGPIVLLYLFYSLGGGSFYVFTKKKSQNGNVVSWEIDSQTELSWDIFIYVTPRQGGIHPSVELMDLRGHQWGGCLECGWCGRCFQVEVPARGCWVRLCGDTAGRGNPALSTQVKLSQQLLRACTGVRTSVSSAFYKGSSLRLQNPARRRILAEQQSSFV